MRRLQVTLRAAKLGARVGAVHERIRPDGICLCINRREDQGTWGLAPGAPASLVVFLSPSLSKLRVPHSLDLARDRLFAESAGLILRSEQRAGGEDVGSSGRSAAIMIDNDHA